MLNRTMYMDRPNLALKYSKYFYLFIINPDWAAKRHDRNFISLLRLISNRVRVPDTGV